MFVTLALFPLKLHCSPSGAETWQVCRALRSGAQQINSEFSCFSHPQLRRGYRWLRCRCGEYLRTCSSLGNRQSGTSHLKGEAVQVSYWPILQRLWWHRAREDPEIKTLMLYIISMMMAKANLRWADGSPQHVPIQAGGLLQIWNCDGNVIQFSERPNTSRRRSRRKEPRIMQACSNSPSDHRSNHCLKCQNYEKKSMIFELYILYFSMYKWIAWCY